MQPFDYVKPKSHAEASALLSEANGAARALLGGTDLIVRTRGGFLHPGCVVDLKGLPGMREIRIQESGWLRIGAGCTMNQVARHRVVADCYPLLAQACNSVASYQLRNRATIGGNICNASPAADSVPALYCLQASVEVYGSGGRAALFIEDFFLGPGSTALQPGQFVDALLLPPPAERHTGSFQKLGRNRAGDIATVSVAAYTWDESAWMSDSRPGHCIGNDETCHQWRIALGAVGPTCLRAREAEIAVTADASPAGVARAADLAAEAARPIDDIRASAAYRRAMVRVLARRAIEAALAVPASRAGGGA